MVAHRDAGVEPAVDRHPAARIPSFADTAVHSSRIARSRLTISGIRAELAERRAGVVRSRG